MRPTDTRHRFIHELFSKRGFPYLIAFVLILVLVWWFTKKDDGQTLVGTWMNKKVGLRVTIEKTGDDYFLIATSQLPSDINGKPEQGFQYCYFDKGCFFVTKADGQPPMACQSGDNEIVMGAIHLTRTE